MTQPFPQLPYGRSLWCPAAEDEDQQSVTDPKSSGVNGNFDEHWSYAGSPVTNFSAA
jgi:hypothetical protein